MVEFLLPIGLAIIGGLLLLSGQRSNRTVLDRLEENSPVLVHVVAGQKKTRLNIGSGPDTYTYHWTVRRVGGGKTEVLEVSEEDFRDHDVGAPIELYEYPGTTRLVHRDHVGGLPALLGFAGVVVLAAAGFWYYVLWHSLGGRPEILGVVVLTASGFLYYVLWRRVGGRPALLAFIGVVVLAAAGIWFSILFPPAL